MSEINYGRHGNEGPEHDHLSHLQIPYWKGAPLPSTVEK
jgi:hypothetical protein